MYRRLVALGVLVTCAALTCAELAGCGRKSYTGDQRFPLSGKVTVNGQPIQLGVIAFMPQGDKARVSGGPIRGGNYSIPEENGANAGTYHVVIHWNKMTGKKIPNPLDRTQIIDEMEEGLPPKYHKNSELTAEVSADQTTFNFDLTTK
jgi:hypothetical protein